MVKFHCMEIFGNIWKYLEIEKTHYVISYVKCVYDINYGNKILHKWGFLKPQKTPDVLSL